MAGKLGRLPAIFDPRTPHLRDHLKAIHFTSPVRQDWAAASCISDDAWGSMLNDALGDCVIASKGHLIELWTRLVGRHITIVLSDDVILQGYEAVGGYVPGNPSTDQGCNMLTAAQYFQATGFGGHRISAYAAVAPGDAPTVQAAINLFGCCDCGFTIPKSAFTQFDEGQPWTVVHDDGGSVGGHDVPLIGYDRNEDLYWCLTWGRKQQLSGEFFRKYFDEAYTYLSPDWCFANAAPNHYHLAQLATDIGHLNGAAQRQVRFPLLLAWIKRILAKYGEGGIVIVETLVATLPLTPAQIKIIDALLETVLVVPTPSSV